MPGYAAVLQTNFIEMFGNGFNAFISWMQGIPLYWHLIAVVVFILLLKTLTSKKRYKK